MLKVKLCRAPREDAAQPRALPLADAAGVPPALRPAAAAAGFTGAAGQVVVLPLPEGRVLLAGIGRAARPLDWEMAGGAAAVVVWVVVASVVASPGAETFGPPMQEVKASAPANIIAARRWVGRRLNWGKYVLFILLRYDGKTRFYRA